jgi:hypothetical protein
MSFWWLALARVAKWLSHNLHIVFVDQISDSLLLDLRDLVATALNYIRERAEGLEMLVSG